MNIDKDKVNKILLEFQNSLQKYKPNSSELSLITRKINIMANKNLQKTMRKKNLSSLHTTFKPIKNDQPPLKQQKRYKIPID